MTALQGPTLGLLLCCHSLKILSNFQARSPPFPFALGLTNYVANSGSVPVLILQKRKTKVKLSIVLSRPQIESSFSAQPA